MKMERQDIKEKLILLGITIGVFLPLRVLFAALISENWIGNLGLMTGFALVLVLLIKKNKLGWFGRMFERQMRKSIRGKTVKVLIGFSLFFMIYFGATLFFIERGNEMYSEDKEIFHAAILNQGDFNIEDISSYGLIGPKIMAEQNMENMQLISNMDYLFSIAYAVMNDMSDGWVSHFVVVLFVEQIEVIFLIILFRNTFKKVPQKTLKQI